jgi:hypothetical protein
LIGALSTASVPKAPTVADPPAASDTVVRTFVCECGDPACEIDLELTVAEVAASPALAPGHR